MAGVAQSHIHLRFAWQAWHSWHWVARLGPLWSRVTPRHFALAGVALGDIYVRFTWQASHNLTSTFVLRGRRELNEKMSAVMSHSRHFHTDHLSRTRSFTHTHIYIYIHTYIRTHTYIHTYVHTYINTHVHAYCNAYYLFTYLLALSHTIFHIPLCHTHSCFNFSILHLLSLSFLPRPCYNL